MSEQEDTGQDRELRNLMHILDRLAQLVGIIAAPSTLFFAVLLESAAPQFFGGFSGFVTNPSRTAAPTAPTVPVPSVVPTTPGEYCTLKPMGALKVGWYNSNTWKYYNSYADCRSDVNGYTWP